METDYFFSRYLINNVLSINERSIRSELIIENYIIINVSIVAGAAHDLIISGTTINAFVGYSRITTLIKIIAGALGRNSVIFADFWYSFDFLEGLAIIGTSGGKKNNVRNFKRSSKTSNRVFTIEVVTNNKISFKEISLLIFRFYGVKKGGGLIEASIRIFINIGIFIVKGFRIYKYDIIFPILDYF